MSEFTLKTLEYILRTDPEKRSDFGQFFTPKNLRDELIEKIPRLKCPKVLDPACGSGEFLLSAKGYFKDPELYGWEIDQELAKIAKELVPEAKIEVVDSLRKPFKEEFDVVIGNPPYYEFRPDPEIKEKFKEIIFGRVNVYSLFIYLGLKMLKPGGYLAYVVSSSMNNGAYFKKLREYIVKNAEIEYLRVLRDPYAFKDPRYKVNHTFQLLVLRKTRNTGKYVVRHNGLLIFSEKYEFLRKKLTKGKTLRDLGYKVKTGKVIWNENRKRLRNSPSEGILLIWSHNIKKGALDINNGRRPQYISWPLEKADKGPAIVVARVIGHPKRATLEAALIPPGINFVAENHVNVIYPPKGASVEEMKEIVRQLNSPEIASIVREITGNTQISKTELENLIPLEIRVIRSPYHRVLF